VPTITTLRRDLPPTQQIIGGLLIAVSLAYLVLFVPRGWIPHDEGWLGQSAETVLRGGMPHVDYQERYTGGLTWFYAEVFRFGRIDALTLRWVLFAGAALAQLITYSLLKRYLGPVAAAVSSCVALVWSFPNYFAPLPSWWLLICALCCLWAFVRYVETGTIWFAALAGLATGVAVVVKQTGVYLTVALVMSLLYQGSGGIEPAVPGSRTARLVRTGVAIGAVLFALAIMRSKLGLSEMLYLLLPIAACSRLLISSGHGTTAATNRAGWSALMVAVAFAALPVACFAAPYIVHRQLPALINGLLILPQRHFAFASMDMPAAHLILLGIPIVTLLTPFPDFLHWSLVRGYRLAIASVIVALSLTTTSLYNRGAYQILWESSRAFGALLPLVIGWLLMSGHIQDLSRQRILFASGSMLAWASLVQFPFSAPIYFCYVTPLAILAAAAAADVCPPNRRLALGAWGAMLLLFGVLTMNRGYVYNLGQFHAPQALDVNLDLPRAHLRVSATDAATYHRLVALIDRHAGDGDLRAGPDCPDVFFLTGRVNPSGTLFDFFSEEGTALGSSVNTHEWAGTNVIVMNHQADFSPPPSSALVAEIRQVFRSGELVGKFEVRWR
jgi:hypothetical protein